ncbi:hypothetical protein GCM10009116_08000 [Brevundimonas basaltis]|uniref:EAL domain-containing protein n=1 Tax=Brevundimonas basaltis TaxID=472166 RepID=A0A7W8MHI2_9CAUL|nr:hypothetical protein [Brevundimonas basaltis]MBB5292272.1 hypothetical protein [Brevundimonas basaltis]
MRNDPGYLAPTAPPSAADASGDGLQEAIARIGERRSYAAPYESLTFTLLTRARRELVVTLAAQPVFDLIRSAPVARRIRRNVRHRGGESALIGLGRRTLEPADLIRIDTQTLRNGLDLLRLGRDDSGVLPAFWRTVASSGGRFDLLCAEMQHGSAPGILLIEIMGGLEQAPTDAIQEAIQHFETGSLGLILHVAPDADAAKRLSQVRAQCLAIDFAGVEHESARDWQAAIPLIQTARKACPQVMLLNLRPDRGLAAQAAGATHAVFAGMDTIVV